MISDTYRWFIYFIYIINFNYKKHPKYVLMIYFSGMAFIWIKLGQSLYHVLKKIVLTFRMQAYVKNVFIFPFYDKWQI